MSDQSQTEGNAPEETAESGSESQQQGPPEWLGPITQRMDELGESTGRMADQLAELYQRSDQQPGDEKAEDLDLYDDDGDLTPEGAQALIDQRVDERLTQTLSQRDAAQALEQREDAFEALREEIPALADDTLAARLVRETAAYLQQHGQEAVIDTPMFVDLIEDRYFAEQYRERVAAEKGAGSEQEVVLESASGASQPTASKEPDWGERIVKAAESLRPQI